MSLEQPDSESLRAGLLFFSGDMAAVGLAGAPLISGTPVTVVIDVDRQEVRFGTVGRRLNTGEKIVERMLISQVAGPFYEFIGEPDTFDLGTVGIVVVGRAEATRVGNAVNLRIAGISTGIQARSCASMEGAHYTLWAGVPLQSVRVWHAYYYLGYDTEPTCTPADYAGG